MVALAVLAGAGRANAVPPIVTISATATEGAAPLVVTFTAHGDAASYHWQLGNGKTAAGPVASATYGPGSWTASVIATAADGSTAQASVDVRSVVVRLRRAQESRYGKPAVFRGSVVPALAGESVGLYVRGSGMAATRAAPDGTFELRVRRLRTPGPYEARSPLASSRPVFLKVQSRAADVVRCYARRRGAARRTCAAGCGRRARRPRLLRSRARARDACRGRGGLRCLDRLPSRLPRGRSATSGPGVVGGGGGCPRDGRQREQRARGAGSERPECRVPVLPRAWIQVPTATEFRGAEPERFPATGLRRAPDCGSAARTCRAKRRRPLLGVRLLVPRRRGALEVGVRAGGGRTGARARRRMLGEPLLSAAADAAFRGLRPTLLLPIAGGLWIREYGFTQQVILNAQRDRSSRSSHTRCSRTAPPLAASFGS